MTELSAEDSTADRGDPTDTASVREIVGAVGGITFDRSQEKGMSGENQGKGTVGDGYAKGWSRENEKPNDRETHRGDETGSGSRAVNGQKVDGRGHSLSSKGADSSKVETADGVDRGSLSGGAQVGEERKRPRSESPTLETARQPDRRAQDRSTEKLPNRSRPSPADTAGDSKRAKQTCFRCGGTNHIASMCPSPKGALDNPHADTCQICDGKGHLSGNCPTVVGGGNPCYVCMQPGHFARECPNAPGRQQQPMGYVGPSHQHQQHYPHPHHQQHISHQQHQQQHQLQGQSYGYGGAQGFAGMNSVYGPGANSYGNATVGYGVGTGGYETYASGNGAGHSYGPGGGYGYSGIVDGSVYTRGGGPPGRVPGAGYGGVGIVGGGVGGNMSFGVAGGGGGAGGSGGGGSGVAGGGSIGGGGSYGSHLGAGGAAQGAYGGAGGGPAGGYGGGGGYPPPRNAPVPGSGRCFRCNAIGHWTRDCPQRPADADPNGCYKCGRLGHRSRECSACYKCFQDGHRAVDCPRPLP